MSTMELHRIIGLIIEVVLLAATGLALVAVLVIMVSRFLDDSKDLDVIGSHLVSADGKSWDFPKEGSDPKKSGAWRYSQYTKGRDWEKIVTVTTYGPDDEEEGGPDDVPEMVEFDAPNYAELEAEKVKTLKPKNLLK